MISPGEPDVIIPVGQEPAPIRAPAPLAPGAGAPSSIQPTDRRHTGDRFKEINDFVDVTLRTLRRNEMAIWLILWRDSRNGTARTAQSDIAKRAGSTTRTVKRAIRRLKSAGLLSVTHQGGLNRGMSVYKVQNPRSDRQGTD